MDVGPCPQVNNEIQYLIAILAALNVALNTWLANRRSRADRREYHRENGKMVQRALDEERDSQAASRKAGLD